jgi:hypothetical protein
LYGITEFPAGKFPWTKRLHHTTLLLLPGQDLHFSFSNPGLLLSYPCLFTFQPLRLAVRAGWNLISGV